VNARSAGILLTVVAFAPAAPQAERPATIAALSRINGTCHHYTISARIRPLLFWIGKDDVGDAAIATKRDTDGAAYAVLIGSDPDRTPRRINRWGYISEEIRGDDGTVVGLMTESDETSVSEAEANLQRQNGERTFNVIRTSVVDGEAHSVVTSAVAPAEYTFRHVDVLLNLVDTRGREGTTRVLKLTGGTRPGFLAGLADIIHAQVAQWQMSHTVSPSAAITYVYYGKLYQLRAVRSRAVTNLHTGGAVYPHAIASEFQTRNLADGGLTDFSLTFAAEGPLAETVLAATYQPEWWIEIQLSLDDTKPAPKPLFATRNDR
jgi:hypothetical protein